MKILKSGELPDTRRWGKCSHCGCIIECDVDEARIISDPREGDDRCVDCPTPTCGGTIWVTEQKLYPHSEEG